MAYEKTKVGILTGFLGMILVILGLFIPTSTIFVALLIVILFVIPMLVLASIIVIGASTVSKKLRKSARSDKKAIVTSASD
jgi:hypothetical protein